MNDDKKPDSKVSSVMKQSGRGAWSAYRALYYGDLPLHKVMWAETVALLLSGMGGALGLLLRSHAYRPLLAEAGPKVLFGRHPTLRHPGKIRIGARTIIDDHCLLDAKGDTNKGLTLGEDVYIGRNTHVYCKNGDIAIGNRVNISAHCTMMSSNAMSIGAGTVIGAYTYLLSGGEYDYRSDTPYAEQTGMNTRGPLSIGQNCWLGARVTVLDAASIGDGCVIGAGSVVTRPVPAHSLAVGTPAKVVKTLP